VVKLSAVEPRLRTAVENKYPNLSSLSLATKATLLGTLYSKGMILPIRLSDGFPEFGRIHSILVVGTEVSFIVEQLSSWYFEHFRAYEIVGSTYCNVAIVNPQDLIDFYPLASYNVGGKIMVSAKRFLLF